MHSRNAFLYVVQRWFHLFMNAVELVQLHLEVMVSLLVQHRPLIEPLFVIQLAWTPWWKLTGKRHIFIVLLILVRVARVVQSHLLVGVHLLIELLARDHRLKFRHISFELLKLKFWKQRKVVDNHVAFDLPDLIIRLKVQHWDTVLYQVSMPLK